MGAVFANNAATTLSFPLNAGDTTINITSGATFPQISGDDYFIVTLVGLDNNGNEAVWEIVKVVDASGNTWTVERGQEGTTDRYWPQATRVELRLTAGQLLSATQFAAALDDAETFALVGI